LGGVSHPSYNMFDDLNDDNFIMYAMKAYESPQCLMSEFEGDLKRTKYLKRLFRKYKATRILKERLILNHLILLYNVFGAEASTRILFYRIDEKDYDVLKTFLLYLNFMPDKVLSINGKDIISSNINVDLKIAEILRQL
jgi:hypothetical protein